MQTTTTTQRTFGETAMASASLRSVHPRDKGIACAIFVAHGKCPVGNCPYLHVTSETKRAIPSRVCPHYALKRCLRDDCAFYHLPQAKLELLRASGAAEYCPLEGLPIRDPLAPLPNTPLLAAGEETGARRVGDASQNSSAPQAAYSAPGGAAPPFIHMPFQHYPHDVPSHHHHHIVSPAPPPPFPTSHQQHHHHHHPPPPPASTAFLQHHLHQQQQHQATVNANGKNATTAMASASATTSSTSAGAQHAMHSFLFPHPTPFMGTTPFSVPGLPPSPPLHQHHHHHHGSFHAASFLAPFNSSPGFPPPQHPPQYHVYPQQASALQQQQQQQQPPPSAVMPPDVSWTTSTHDMSWIYSSSGAPAPAWQQPPPTSVPPFAPQHFTAPPPPESSFFLSPQFGGSGGTAGQRYVSHEPRDPAGHLTPHTWFSAPPPPPTYGVSLPASPSPSQQQQQQQPASWVPAP